MTHEAVRNILETIIHPVFQKDIINLDIVQTIQIGGNTVEISLNIDDNSIYAPIANSISKAFKPYFSEIRIMKQMPKVSISSPANKNNRAYDKNALAVVSSKGGVGKSTIALSLAINFAKKGLQVGILDGDINNPSIAWLLHVNSQNVLIKNPNLKLINTQMVLGENSLDLNKLDLLIIDLPTKLSESEKFLFEKFHLMEALFITTPHGLSHNGAEQTIQKLQESSVNLIGFIENMSDFVAPESKSLYPILGKSRTQSLCKHYALPLLAKIPLQLQQHWLEAVEENSPYEPLAQTLLARWN